MNARIPVVAFPADAEGWIAAGMHPGRVQSTVATPGESFSLGNLPSGDYLVATVPDNLSADFQDPAVIRAIACSAERVHLESGDNKNIVIQLKRTKTARSLSLTPSWTPDAANALRWRTAGPWNIATGKPTR